MTRSIYSAAPQISTKAEPEERISTQGAEEKYRADFYFSPKYTEVDNTVQARRG